MFITKGLFLGFIILLKSIKANLVKVVAVLKRPIPLITI